MSYLLERLNGTGIENNNISPKLSDIAGVTPENGKALVWTGTGWEPQSPLGGLATPPDVVVSVLGQYASRAYTYSGTNDTNWAMSMRSGMYRELYMTPDVTILDATSPPTTLNSAFFQMGFLLPPGKYFCIAHPSIAQNATSGYFCFTHTGENDLTPVNFGTQARIDHSGAGTGHRIYGVFESAENRRLFIRGLSPHGSAADKNSAIAFSWQIQRIG
jgi:hypothetical protein